MTHTAAVTIAKQANAVLARNAGLKVPHVHLVLIVVRILAGQACVELNLVDVPPTGNLARFQAIVVREAVEVEIVGRQKKAAGDLESRVPLGLSVVRVAVTAANVDQVETHAQVAAKPVFILANAAMDLVAEALATRVVFRRTVLAL